MSSGRSSDTGATLGTVLLFPGRVQVVSLSKKDLYGSQSTDYSLGSS